MMAIITGKHDVNSQLSFEFLSYGKLAHKTILR